MCENRPKMSNPLLGIPEFDRFYFSSHNDPITSSNHDEEEWITSEIDTHCVTSNEPLSTSFYMLCHEHGLTPIHFFEWCYTNGWTQYNWKNKKWEYHSTSDPSFDCPKCRFLNLYPSFRSIEEYLFVDWYINDDHEITMQYWIPKEYLAYVKDHWSVGDLIPIRITSFQQFQETSETLEKTTRVEWQWFMHDRTFVPCMIDEEDMWRIPYSLCQEFGYQYFMDKMREESWLPNKEWAAELNQEGTEWLVFRNRSIGFWIEPCYMEQPNEKVKEEWIPEQWKVKHQTLQSEEEEEEEEDIEKIAEEQIGQLLWKDDEECLYVRNEIHGWEPLSSQTIYPNSFIQTHTLGYYQYYCQMYQQTMNLLISPIEMIQLPEMVCKTIEMEFIDKSESSLDE